MKSPHKNLTRYIDWSVAVGPFGTGQASCGNSTLPETAGSSRTHGCAYPKRKLIFAYNKKTPFFYSRKMCLWVLSQPLYFLRSIVSARGIPNTTTTTVKTIRVSKMPIATLSNMCISPSFLYNLSYLISVELSISLEKVKQKKHKNHYFCFINLAYFFVCVVTSNM